MHQSPSYLPDDSDSTRRLRLLEPQRFLQTVRSRREVVRLHGIPEPLELQHGVHAALERPIDKRPFPVLAEIPPADPDGIEIRDRIVHVLAEYAVNQRVAERGLIVEQRVRQVRMLGQDRGPRRGTELLAFEVVADADGPLDRRALVARIAPAFVSRELVG